MGIEAVRVPRADTSSGVAREFRAAATRLERLARQLPPDSQRKVDEIIRLLRDHAERLVKLTRRGPMAMAPDRSTER